MLEIHFFFCLPLSIDKEMALCRIIIIGFLLGGIDRTTFSILEENIRAGGIYGGGSDSIGIPIAGTQILSLVLCPFLLLILCISKSF